MNTHVIAVMLSLSLASTATPLCAQQAEVSAFSKALNFSTKGHPKANGLNLTLKYPRTWVLREGNRPHMVQAFVDGRPPGVERCLLGIRDMGRVMSDSDVKEALAPTMLRSFVPAGSDILSLTPTTLDGQPAAVVTVRYTQSSAGQPITIYSQDFTTFYLRSMITLGCSIGWRNDSPELADHFRKYSTSLFPMIANSIVIQDKWINPGR
jgi:hypothetical protein